MKIEDKISEVVASQIKFNGVKDWDKLYNDIVELLNYRKTIDEEKLDKFKDQCMNTYRWYEYDMRSFLKGIEIGYRKAMEE